MQILAYRTTVGPGVTPRPALPLPAPHPAPLAAPLAAPCATPLERHASEAESADSTFRVRVALPHRDGGVRSLEWSGSQCAPHVDDAFELVLCDVPGTIVQVNGRQHRLARRAMVVLNAGELHGFRAPGGRVLRVRALHVPTRVVATAVGQDHRASGRISPFAVHLFDDEEAFAEGTRLFDALDGRVTAAEWERRLTALLATLFRRHAGAAVRMEQGTVTHRDVLSRVRTYIDDAVERNIGLDELAAVAGLSKFYLLRAFGRHYGLPPRAYQMQLRLARARRLLEAGYPVSRVAYDCGFADQSHLTRRFKPYHGLTPALYARLHAEASAIGWPDANHPGESPARMQDTNDAQRAA